MTRLAREYFAFGRDEYPGIRVFHEDARVYLGRADRKYDVVYLDVFDNLLSVPWTVVTEEAFAEMAALLQPGGRVVANIISPRAGPGVAFFQRVQATEVGDLLESQGGIVHQPDRSGLGHENVGHDVVPVHEGARKPGPGNSGARPFGRALRLSV